MWDSLSMVRARIPALWAAVCLLAALPTGTCAQGQPQQPAPAQKPVPGKPPSQPQQQPPEPQAAEPVPSPVSRHYPILIIGHGADPVWSLRLGMKGPERLDRLDYPPIVLDPGEVTVDQPTGEWTYNAKDEATGATVAVKLTRDACSDPGTPEMKYTFRVDIRHAQIGVLSGCGQSAPDKFPEFRKKNQIDMPDEMDPNAKDKDKDKKTVLEPITKFQSPVDIAYLDTAGRAIVAHGGVHKTAATTASDLALSGDGKKLLFTYSASSTSPDRWLMLFDYESGHSRQISAPNVRAPFWSPDDSRIAFLKFNGQTWQVMTAPASAPETEAALSSVSVSALDGWVNANTVLASDLQNLYWLSEDRPAQSVPLKDIYGSEFQVLSSDTIRVCPVNPDLLLVSAYYLKAPAGAPTDSMGLNEAFFLYEVRSKRRTILGPADGYARNAVWSRDGLQIFFTKGVPGKGAVVTDRIFWDGTGQKRYASVSDLVIGR